MAKTLVCYHRDLDGFGAAFAFWKKYMRDKNFKAAHGEVEYESVQYGEPFPKKASDYTHIYVLTSRSIVPSVTSWTKSPS